MIVVVILVLLLVDIDFVFFLEEEEDDRDNLVTSKYKKLDKLWSAFALGTFHKRQMALVCAPD